MLPLPLRRRHGDVFGLDAAVVFGNLLGPGVIGAQAFPELVAVTPARGEFLRAVEKAAAVDIAVDIEIEEIQQLLRVIGGFLSFHMNVPF